MLRFSALARTILTGHDLFLRYSRRAGVRPNFFECHRGIVSPLPQLHFVIINNNASGFCSTNLIPVSTPPASSPQLTISTSRNEVRMDCTPTLRQPLSAAAKLTLICSVCPILTMRFALSLKRTADTGHGTEWRDTSASLPGPSYFTSVKFAGSSSNTRASTAHVGIEMNPVNPLNDRQEAYEP